MSKMILRGGRFYKDNIEIPPEIGNQDQIRLLKESEQRINELTEGTHEPDIEEELIRRVDVRFKCVCGSNVYRGFELDELQDLNKEARGVNIRCKICNKKYRFDIDEYEDIVVKLIP